MLNLARCLAAILAVGFVSAGCGGRPKARPKREPVTEEPAKADEERSAVEDPGGDIFADEGATSAREASEELFGTTTFEEPEMDILKTEEPAAPAVEEPKADEIEM